MKKNEIWIFKLITVSIFLISAVSLNAQRGQTDESNIVPSTPKIALKTNLLYDATTTFNLGLEFKLSDKYTLDLSGNYNPWTFSGGKKLKHVLIQPELRYWLCEPFYGHFFGLHALYTHYNVAKIDLPFGIFDNLGKYRYQGDGCK